MRCRHQLAVQVHKQLHIKVHALLPCRLLPASLSGCCWAASLAWLLLLLLLKSCTPLFGAQEAVHHNVVKGGLLCLTDVEEVTITTCTSLMVRLQSQCLAQQRKRPTIKPQEATHTKPCLKLGIEPS